MQFAREKARFSDMHKGSMARHARRAFCTDTVLGRSAGRKLVQQSIPHLRVKSWVLDVAVEEDPQVVFHHKGLDVGMLILLVDFLSQGPEERMCAQACGEPLP